MYYLIGDIHGCLNNLVNLYRKIKKTIEPDDTLIFLGDYIDRGPSSYEVIEYLLDISGDYKTVFLKGNHEDMFLKYKSGSLNPNGFDPNGFNPNGSNPNGSDAVYFENGGFATIKSYKKNGSNNIPLRHQVFYENLQLYYETEDFIAVHAGLNPIYNTEEQSEYDMLWIRESFFNSGKAWDKTVIFGHTPCSFLHGKMKTVYTNDTNNIIGIDTGACYGGILTCFRWPDKMIFQG